LQYAALLKNNISRTSSALCILWTVAQAGFTSLPAGLTGEPALQHAMYESVTAVKHTERGCW